jgi:hypothetical protein
MTTRLRYQYLKRGPSGRSRELFVSGTGIRASTIWHDRYISILTPAQIAEDRDIPLEAVYESLAFCQENWEKICKEKDLERRKLEQKGFLR